MLANPVVIDPFSPLVFWFLYATMEFLVVLSFIHASFKGQAWKEIYKATLYIHMVTMPATWISAMSLQGILRAESAGYFAEIIPFVGEYFLWAAALRRLSGKGIGVRMATGSRIAAAVIAANLLTFGVGEVRRVLTPPNPMREGVKITVCRTKLFSIDKALRIYEDVFSDFPSKIEGEPLVELVRCGITGLHPKQLICPASGTDSSAFIREFEEASKAHEAAGSPKEGMKPFQHGVSDYEINPAWLGATPDQRKQMDPAMTPWIWEKALHPRTSRPRRNVLFLDGRVETLLASDFRSLLEAGREVSK